MFKTSKEIFESLQTPMPEYIIKQKEAGKTTLSYVSGQAVIDKLNATFGYCGWSWEIVDKFIQQSEDKIIKTKYINGRKETLVEPEREQQQPVCHVVGRLTVYLEKPDGGIHTIFKEAPGAQCLVGGQSEQENCFKGAHTDALKKAATMFGVGLELYRDDNEQYFHNDLHYVNPWTEEVKAQLSDELAYISGFKSSNSFTDEDMNYYISQFTFGSAPTMEYLTPDLVVGFVEYLKGVVSCGN